MVSMRADVQTDMQAVLFRSSTSVTAVTVSNRYSVSCAKQVRQLDTTQSHVQQTLSAITVILDRSNCIYGVREALDSGDFEAAAGAPQPPPPPPSQGTVPGLVFLM